MKIYNGCVVYEVGTRVILIDRCPKYRVEENGWFWDNSLIAGVAGDLFVNDDDDIESASFGKFFDRFSIKHKR